MKLICPNCKTRNKFDKKKDVTCTNCGIVTLLSNVKTITTYNPEMQTYTQKTKVLPIQ